MVTHGAHANEMGNYLPIADIGTGGFASLVETGGASTCVILKTGGLKCWGSNDHGQLGQGDGITRSSAGDSVPVINLGTGRSATQIAMGQQFMCALLDNGSVKCWGSNYSGQLGLGDTLDRGNLPGQMGDALPAVNLGTGRTAVRITAALAHACAILDNGALKCWGQNAFAQLGQGDYTNRGTMAGQMGDMLLPISLGMGRTAVGVAVSSDNTCAILDNLTVKCFGLGNRGECGQASTADCGTSAGTLGNALPVINIGSGFTPVPPYGVSMGWVHVCARSASNQVKCWGYNGDGELGIGDVVNRGTMASQMGDFLPFVSLGSGRTVTQMVSTMNGNCALLDDHTIKCWGINSSGELGQGDTTNRGTAAGQMGDSLPIIQL